jgi:translation initiation factor 6
MLQLLDFNENPNVGVFCRANENIAFVQKGLSTKIKKKISEVLNVDVVELSIADASIIGSLLAFNSKGAVVTDFIDVDGLKTIKDQSLEICVISDKYNAAGNDILVNDKGALVHPDISKNTLQNISETLSVPVSHGTIGTLKTVGMAAVVTNKGLLCHPKASDDEKRTLEKVFDVSVMIGTVNHGSPVIGSGLVANSKGAIIGNLTTGIEMGRIEEALGFLD